MQRKWGIRLFAFPRIAVSNDIKALRLDSASSADLIISTIFELHLIIIRTLVQRTEISKIERSVFA